MVNNQHFLFFFYSADKDEEQYICIRFLKDYKERRNKPYKKFYTFSVYLIRM